MNDITQNDLLQMALRNIENAEKQAFVSASVITAPPVDPAADPAAQGAAPQGMPPSGPVGMPQESPAATVAPGTAAPPGAPPEQANSVSGAMPPEAYDQLVAAVRQVMQELGQAPGGSQQAPAGPAEAAQPSQSEKPKGKKGGVDPEEFAKMQAAVAMILEQLGMVSAGEGMLPTQAAPPDAAGTMGASPGVAQNPPPEAQEAPPPLPTGPLDPRASEYMQAAGPAARARASQVGKLAALITGRRP